MHGSASSGLSTEKVRTLACSLPCGKKLCLSGRPEVAQFPYNRIGKFNFKVTHEEVQFRYISKPCPPIQLL